MTDNGNTSVPNPIEGHTDSGHLNGFNPACPACTRQADQDWHMQLHREYSDSDLRVRLHRALSMAQRAVGRNDWVTYDEWIAEAKKFRDRLHYACPECGASCKATDYSDGRCSNCTVDQ